MKKRIIKNTKKMTFIAASVLLAMNSSLSTAAPIKVDFENPTAEEVSKAENLTYEELETVKVILEKSGKSEVLSPYELELIKKKQHSLFKYLYEQEQLEELRNMLSDTERGKNLKNMVDQEHPLNSTEIYSLRKLTSSIEKAKNSPLDGPINLNIKTINIDVDAPKPIEIKVAMGYNSSIMFFDQTGKPWPIDGEILGDIKSFKTHSFESKDHVGVFEITRSFVESNALVNLKDLNVLVVIRLTGSDKEVDSRISVHIPKFGPNASKGSYLNKEIDSKTSPDMLSILNGDRLVGGKEYDLHGVQGTVWHKNDDIYIRTRENLISPPWKSNLVSATGYQVYQLNPVTNLIFTVNGEMKNATIEKGFEVKIRQEKSIFE